MADFPPPISLSTLEGLIDKYPDVYDAIRNLVVSLNTQQNFLQEQFDYAGPPLGPRSVIVYQLGGTIQVNWGSDNGPSPIVVYRVYRADAGTRGTPTTPVWSASVNVAVQPAQDVGCLIGTDYTTGAYTWIDRNFTITELDPANPARKTYWVSSVDNQGRESIPVQATGSPIELLTNGKGEQPVNTATSSLNLFRNAQFNSPVTTTNLDLNNGIGAGYTINAANITNGTPIIVTVNVHPFANGETVEIYGVNGCTAANGRWIITVTGVNTITLNGSIGNGAATASNGILYWFGNGANWTTLIQPLPLPLSTETDGTTISATPWHGRVGNANTTMFVSDGVSRTGEALINPGLGNSFAINQYISTQRFSNSIHVTVSIYAKAPTQPTAVTNLYIQFQINYSGNFFYVQSPAVNVSNLTTTYKRLSFTFALPAGFKVTTGFDTISSSCVVAFNVTVGASGVPQPIYLTRPMINFGDLPAEWTSSMQTSEIPGILTNNIVFVPSQFSRTPTDIVMRNSSAPYA